MSQIGTITNKSLSSHNLIIENANQKLGNSHQGAGFGSRLEQALDSVADAQNISAKTSKNFELGLENDLTKVMINQQVFFLM